MSSEAANVGTCYFFTQRSLHNTCEQLLAESLSESNLSFHLQRTRYTADTRSEAGRVYGGEVCSSSGCTVGEFKVKVGLGNCSRQWGHFRSAYLEVVIRVFGFIFPGIAGC